MSGALAGLLERLPQGPAARLLDAVARQEPGRSATAHTTFPPGHRVFDGHLPDEPIVPGVVVIEALAQTAAVALADPAGRAPIRGLLAGVARIRFLRRVRPGERITLVATLARRLGTAALFDVAASVDQEPVARGSITVGDLAGD